MRVWVDTHICWPWISTTCRPRTKTQEAIFVSSLNICLTCLAICNEEEQDRSWILVQCPSWIFASHFVSILRSKTPKYPSRHFRRSSKFLLPFPEILRRSFNYAVLTPGVLGSLLHYINQQSSTFLSLGFWTLLEMFNCLHRVFACHDLFSYLSLFLILETKTNSSRHLLSKPDFLLSFPEILCRSVNYLKNKVFKLHDHLASLET